MAMACAWTAPNDAEQVRCPGPFQRHFRAGQGWMASSDASHHGTLHTDF